MGEVSRCRVVRVKGSSRDALQAAATRECEQHTALKSCERVLVVYGERAANLYIESTPSRPAVVRKTA